MPELSGLEFMILAKEMNDRLRGSYVNNVYSLGDSQIIRLRSQNGDIWLLISPKHGAWISESISERAETTEFTSSIRKHIQRLKLSMVRQIDLDRILEFSFIGYHKRSLILELIPPGNVIILDESGKVLLAQREISRGRRVVRNEQYVPPLTGKMTIDRVDAGFIRSIMVPDENIGRLIGRNIAIPKKYIDELLKRLGARQSDSASKFIGREEEFAKVVRSIYEDAINEPWPNVARTEEGEEIFAIKTSFLVIKYSDTLSRICDEIFLPIILQEAEGKGAEQRRKEELETTLQRLKEEREKLAKDASKLRELASSIITCSTIEDARIIIEKESIIPKQILSRVENASSVHSIASAIYSHAKTLEEKMREIMKAEESILKKVRRTSIEVKLTEQIRRKKREWYEKFRWFITSTGKLAVGGRDAQSNSILIKRYMQKGDTVYHADLYGSPFFILKEGERQTDEDIAEVAQATVAFSSAWKIGLASADAYWVYPEQVSSAAPSGEYLPKGSFLIKGKKNFVNHNIVEIAIGIDKNGKLMCGPEASIKKHTTAYLVLRPHREKSSETAKKVMKELSLIAKIEEREFSLDDILRALPTGGGKILRRKLGDKPKNELNS